MKGKGVCLILAMMLVLGMMGTTALATNRLPNIFSGGFSMRYWPGSDSITSIEIDYERALNTGLSLHAKGRLALLSGVTNLGALVGVKKYLEATAPEGLWIGAFGTFSHFSGSGDYETTFGGGAEAGYRYFFSPIISIEPYAQLGYYTAAVGFAFTFGANLGYSF